MNRSSNDLDDYGSYLKKTIPADTLLIPASSKILSEYKEDFFSKYAFVTLLICSVIDWDVFVSRLNV